MPVGLKDSRCTYFDGPPRVVALGFQLSYGHLGEPADLFEDTAFDHSRRTALQMAEYIRRNGPISPAILGPEELEYTGIVETLKKLEPRFQTVG